MQTLTKELAEIRIILHPVSWSTFNQLVMELGNKRAKKFAYYQGYLEIMSPLGEHESNNRFIDSLIGAIADELNINMKRMGSLTLKRDDLKQGVEPDSCYYFQNEPQIRNKQNINLNSDPPPDLVLEIDITSGSLNKLPIYAALSVPEIWRYTDNKIEVFVLDKHNLTYQKLPNSLIFPWLNLEQIPQLINQTLIEGQTATLRTFRHQVRDQLPSI